MSAGRSSDEAPARPVDIQVTSVRFALATVQFAPDIPVAHGVSLVDFDDDGQDDIGIATTHSIVLLRRTPAGFDRQDIAIPGAMGFVWADVDDDGQLELLVLRRDTVSGNAVTLRRPALLRLVDGTWKDVAADSGLTMEGDWAGGAFGDLDGDGDLDLVLSGGAIEQGNSPICHGDHGDRGTPNRLLLNDGHGIFTDVSTAVGCVGLPDGEGFTVALWDFDMDGDLDVFWTNDFRPKTLCRNDGSGHFDDVSLPALGLLGSTGAMGAAVGDLDGDACPELYATNVDRDLIFSSSGGLRVDSAYDGMMAAEEDTSQARSGWGVSLFDADFDGDLDVATISAWLPLPEGGGMSGGMSFYNNRREADGVRLVDQGWATHDLFNQRLSGWGLASGDYDGDVDVLLGLDPTHSPERTGPSGPPLARKHVVCRQSVTGAHAAAAGAHHARSRGCGGGQRRWGSDRAGPVRRRELLVRQLIDPPVWVGGTLGAGLGGHSVARRRRMVDTNRPQERIAPGREVRPGVRPGGELRWHRTHLQRQTIHGRPTGEGDVPGDVRACGRLRVAGGLGYGVSGELR